VIKLEFRAIQPDSFEWSQFIDMTYQYLLESWPDRVSGQTESAFKAKYEQTLRHRFAQGGRGLFLYFDGKNAVGFSNAYISEEDHEKTLNIAEFYVAPGYRRQGFATQMKDQLIKWGRLHFATKLKIEVNKDLEPSNRFWSSFGFNLDSSSSKNIYYF